MTIHDKDSLERGRKLFAGECKFLLGAVKVDDLPTYNMPEIAFAGRSNVGKSSLVNAVLGQKIARTSATPGHTRQLNFFMVRKELIVVDLPGYGYAKAAKKEVAGWNYLIYDYLRGRPGLSRVFMLVDSRHGLKDSDNDVMNVLDDAAMSYQIVLTKSDKVKKKNIDDIFESINKIAGEHTALHPEVLVTSSRENEGIDVLRAEIAAML